MSLHNVIRDMSPCLQSLCISQPFATLLRFDAPLIDPTNTTNNTTDEPTSGLDSSTANSVMSIVQGLARNYGQTIVVAIHAPSARVFGMFDDLLVLIRGRTAFYGAASMVGDFAAASLMPLVCARLPELAESLNDAISSADGGNGHLLPNPAEQILELCAAVEKAADTTVLADAWASCAARDKLEARISQSKLEDAASNANQDLSTRRQTATPWWWALLQMARFRTRYNYTNYAYISSRIGDKLILAIVIVTLYLNVGRIWRPDNYINMAAVLFAFVVSIPAFSGTTYLPAIFLERAIFERERADGLYTTATYLAHKLLDEMLIGSVGSLAGVVIVYYGAGLSGSLLLYWLTYFAVVTAAVLLAFLVASLASSMDVANTALPAIFCTFLLFAGFFIRFEDIPRWWAWYSYCHPLRYAFTSVLVNHFGERNPRFLGKITVLAYFGVEGQGAWSNMGIIWCFSGGFLIAAWGALHRKFIKR
jgi:ATP-binding cassette, subfamily G (WHITE), member 2